MTSHPSPKHTLVVGGDSLIGAALAAALRARGDEVTSTSRREDRQAGVVRLDLADAEAVASVDLPRADVAFLCAAMTRIADCRAAPELARRVNAEAPAVLATRLVAAGTRVVFLSTAAVLDGSAPLMAADSPAAPRSAYGRDKADAEAAILALEGAAVVRFGKVVGASWGLVDDWIGKLSCGDPVSAFSDQRFAPLAVSDAVRVLLAVGDNGEGGVFQASGAADVSYAELARHLAGRIGADAALVREGSAAESGIPASEITPYASLDASRLQGLCGFEAPQPWSVIDAVFGPALEKVARARGGAAEA